MKKPKFRLDDIELENTEKPKILNKYEFKTNKDGIDRTFCLWNCGCEDDCNCDSDCSDYGYCGTECYANN